MLKNKLQNIISGYRINEDDEAWLLALEAQIAALSRERDDLSEWVEEARVTLDTVRSCMVDWNPPDFPLGQIGCLLPLPIPGSADRIRHEVWREAEKIAKNCVLRMAEDDGTFSVVHRGSDHVVSALRLACPEAFREEEKNEI